MSFLEQARSRIVHALADIKLPKRYGKHAVLRFTENDDYYRYTAYFDPDGDWAGSSGKCIRNTGYMHIAYPYDGGQSGERQALAHELTHNLLYSFPLPLWLEEALAMLFERDIAGGPALFINREMADQHRAYWNPATIQDFWSGKSFSTADAQYLSYTLARILLDFIVTDVQPPRPIFATSFCMPTAKTPVRPLLTNISVWN